MSVESVAIEMRDWMGKNEAEYLRIKEYVKSPKYAEDQLKTLHKIRNAIKLGPLNESEAMRSIGMVQQILIDAFSHENVVMIYEDYKKELATQFPPSKS